MNGETSHFSFPPFFSPSLFFFTWRQVKKGVDQLTDQPIDQAKQKGKYIITWRALDFLRQATADD
jgi:hypothetical protein